jgi:hypothetical protein
MVINLRQNKNDESTAYGKYFAEVDSKEPLNLKGFEVVSGTGAWVKCPNHLSHRL